jgi:hypothetical protein
MTDGDHKSTRRNTRLDAILSKKASTRTIAVEPQLDVSVSDQLCTARGQGSNVAHELCETLFRVRDADQTMSLDVVGCLSVLVLMRTCACVAAAVLQTTHFHSAAYFRRLSRIFLA